MSWFAVHCNPVGRIVGLLADEAGLLTEAMVGRMASACFTPAAMPCFYEMLVELEDRGVLCGWRFEGKDSRPGARQFYRVSAARDETCILLCGERELDAGHDDLAGAVRDASNGHGQATGNPVELGAIVQKVVGALDPHTYRQADTLAVLAECLVEHLADPAAMLADTRMQVIAFEHLHEMPVQLEDDLLRLAAHDLRSPLLVMSMNVSLLLDQNKVLSAEERTLLSDSLEMCDAMSRYLERMRALAAFSAGMLGLERQPTDLAGLLRQIVQNSALTASNSQIAVVENGLEPVAISVDADKLSFAVTELVNNAVKFCPTGATVQVSLSRQGNDVVILVADNGPGIPAEIQRSLFHPPGKRDRDGKTGTSGAGLGLAVVRRIVEAHGGQVAVTSQPDSGTQIGVRLPVL